MWKRIESERRALFFLFRALQKPREMPSGSALFGPVAVAFSPQVSSLGPDRAREAPPDPHFQKKPNK